MPRVGKAVPLGEPTADLEARPAHEPERPVPAHADVVVAQRIAGPGVGEQVVEPLLVELGDARAHPRRVVRPRRRDSPSAARVHTGDDQLEPLTHDGFDQILTGCQPPSVLAEVGVECGRRFRPGGPDVGDGCRRRRGTGTVERIGDDPEVRVDGRARRRRAGEQLGEHRGLHSPAGGGIEEQPGDDVEAAVLEVQRCPAQVVVDGGPEVLRQLHVVERSHVDGLQLLVGVDDSRPLVVVPTANLVTPRRRSQCRRRHRFAGVELVGRQRDRGTEVDPAVDRRPLCGAGRQAVPRAAVLPTDGHRGEQRREHPADAVREVLAHEPPVAGSGRLPRQLGRHHASPIKSDADRIGHVGYLAPRDDHLRVAGRVRQRGGERAPCRGVRNPCLRRVRVELARSRRGPQPRLGGRQGRHRPRRLRERAVGRTRPCLDPGHDG